MNLNAFHGGQLKHALTRKWKHFLI